MDDGGHWEEPRHPLQELQGQGPQRPPAEAGGPGRRGGGTQSVGIILRVRGSPPASFSGPAIFGNPDAGDAKIQGGSWKFVIEGLGM